MRPFDRVVAHSVRGMACLRTGHFRRLAGHAQSGRPGNQDSPTNRQSAMAAVEGHDAQHRPEPGPRRRDWEEKTAGDPRSAPRHFL